MIDAMKAALKELEDVLECINQDKIPFDGDDFHETLRTLRQAIAEAEKEAALQEIADIGQEIEQEPVAWMIDFIDDRFEVKDFVVSSPEHIGAGYNVRPLYTAPPKREIEQEPESWMGVSDNPYCDDVDCNDPNGRAMRWHNKLLELRKQVALDGLAETSREIEQAPVGEVLNIQWMSNTGGWLIGFHSKRRLYKGDKLYVEPVRCVMVGVCLSKRKIN
jgi:hypothetical protein